MTNTPLGRKFIAYTDGACSGNPGPGGFAFIITYDGDTPEKRGGGSTPLTTNNRMEMQAVEGCLRCLRPDDYGVIRSDSQYVVNGMISWRRGWEKKGRLRDGSLANADLWGSLFRLHDERPHVRFAWVKGHAVDPMNIEVDRLAVAAATQQLPAFGLEDEQPRREPSAIDRIVTLGQERLDRLKNLNAAAQGVVAEACKTFQTDDIIGFLFQSNISLDSPPIELLETGDPEKIEHVRMLVLRILYGVCA